MNIDDAISYFGNRRALADACGLSSVNAISMWRQRGPEVPEEHQYRLHVVTAGELQAPGWGSHRVVPEGWGRQRTRRER